MSKRPYICFWYLTVLLGFFSSCSSIKSGKYIEVQKGDTLEKMAEIYKIDLEVLKTYNSGSIHRKKWVFIPLRRGILRGKISLSKEAVIYSLSSDKLLWPLPSSKNVTSKFGKRWGKNHDGIDISAPSGRHIVASQKGVVVYSGQKISGYGKMVVISHRNSVFTIYAHAQKLHVSRGQRVHRGQVIAQVGSTGKSSGPHLHFEVRYDSQPMNPQGLLSYR